MFRNIFIKKPVLPVQKSIIDLLISNPLDAHLLYLELDKKSKSLIDFSDDFRGFGSVFHKDKRHKLVTASLKIDDVEKSVLVANIDNLVELAKAFKRGNIAGIDKDKNKYVICLVLLFLKAQESTLKQQIADELETIYQGTDFKNSHDRENILALIKPNKQTNAAPVPSIAAITSTLPVDTNVPIVNAQSSKPIQQPIAITSQATQIFPVKNAITKPDVLPVYRSNNIILLVNSLRKLLTENIDTWSHMTTGRLFFCGCKIEHPDPAKQGHFLRVPDGIAKMVNTFKHKNLLNADVTNPDDAKEILQSLCKTAWARFQLGDRSFVRHKETNRLYALLASLTTEGVMTYFPTEFKPKELAAMKRSSVNNVTLDFEYIAKDFLQEINMLLKNDAHSNVIILRR